MIALVVCHNGIDSFEEDFVNAGHLLAATLHVTCSHFLSDRHSLLCCDRGQALRFEKVDACAFRSKVRFETDEDERSVGAEMEDFGVPLWMYQYGKG